MLEIEKLLWLESRKREVEEFRLEKQTVAYSLGILRGPLFAFMFILNDIEIHGIVVAREWYDFV